MQQIDRGIFYENSYLGVTLGALVFSHGVIVIDAPLRLEDTRSWRSAIINQRGGSNRVLVNLDAHPDRTLGSRALDCVIIAHAKAAQVFRSRPTIFKGQTVETGAIWETYTDAIGMRWASPDITFTHRMSLHWGGPEVVLEHHPGPNQGAIWVHIPDAHVLFVGDAVLVNQPPFLAHADFNSWLESLDLLLSSYRNYTIISGRGGPVTQEDIRLQYEFLREVIDAMERLSKTSLTPEAIQDLVPALLSRYSFPAELRELYSVRLRYGLHHCFARRYRLINTLGQTEVADEEQ
jgi:glyoxylase-like metal-dependent hydrolase (beta-lactamase superfamily II)